jgi:Methyltransferase domain
MPPTVNGAALVPQHFISPASFWVPERILASGWIEHAPFAFWLMEAHRPRRVVELGTHLGYSYLVFAQAVTRLGLGLATRCFAIDTWKGDEHAGFYDEEVFRELREYHDPRYAGFSQLVRATFDEAAKSFENGSIDLLHIDGRHFYDDVQHDFITWKPKLSPQALVLFHDICVRERDFGVYRLWDQLRAEYRHFEFLHGHGLGIIGMSGELPEKITELFAASQDASLSSGIQQMYSRLGASLTDKLLLQERTLERDRVNALRAQQLWEGERLQAELIEKNTALQGLATEYGQLQAGFADREAEVRGMTSSSSWRLTAPLRVVGSKLPTGGRRLLRSLIRLLWWTVTLRIFGQLRRSLRLQREKALIAASGMFDRSWYLDHNPDVARAGVDALEHYLVCGGFEGRDPGPSFGSGWYLAQNPDVAQKGMHPLVHYLRCGRAEGRAPTADGAD